MPTYHVGAESLAQLSKDQEMAEPTTPGGFWLPIPPLHLDFIGFAGGPIRGVLFYRGILHALADAWTAAGITGFTTTPVVCRADEQAYVLDPDFVPPTYRQLLVQDDNSGDQGNDVRGAPGDNGLLIPQAAKDILDGFPPRPVRSCRVAGRAQLAH